MKRNFHLSKFFKYFLSSFLKKCIKEKKLNLINQTTDIYCPFSENALFKFDPKFFIANLHSLSNMYNITITANLILNRMLP